VGRNGASVASLLVINALHPPRYCGIVLSYDLPIIRLLPAVISASITGNTSYSGLSTLQDTLG
jgi:hypothetical protein